MNQRMMLSEAVVVGRFSELAPARGAPAMTSDYLSGRIQNYKREIYTEYILLQSKQPDYIVPLMLLRSYANIVNQKGIRR